MKICLLLKSLPVPIPAVFTDHSIQVVISVRSLKNVTGDKESPAWSPPQGAEVSEEDKRELPRPSPEYQVVRQSVTISCSGCLTLCNPTDCSPPGSSIPRQEHQSGLPFSSPGDLPNPGIEPRSCTFAGRFFTV